MRFNSNDQPISNVLNKMVKELGMTQGLTAAKVRKIWSSEMGTMVNRYTTELTVKDNTLVVRVNSAPLRQELIYNSDALLTRLNNALPEPVLKKMEVR